MSPSFVICAAVRACRLFQLAQRRRTKPVRSHICQRDMKSGRSEASTRAFTLGHLQGGDGGCRGLTAPTSTSTTRNGKKHTRTYAGAAREREDGVTRNRSLLWRHLAFLFVYPRFTRKANTSTGDSRRPTTNCNGGSASCRFTPPRHFTTVSRLSANARTASWPLCEWRCSGKE